MTMNAPKQITWIIALVLGVLALVVQFGGVNLPVVSGNSTVVMGAAWLLLILGAVLPGL